MTVALARRWADADHDVVIGSRDLSRAQSVARSIPRGRGAVYRDAAQAEAVVVAVADAVAVEVVGSLADLLTGTVVIDIGNPIDPPDFVSRFGDGRSLAERIAAAAPGARVVKAFNTVYAELLAGPAPADDASRVQVLVASDDEPATATVRELVRDAGCDPFVVGPLRVSRHLERLAGFEVDLVERGFARAVAVRVEGLGG